MKIIFVVILILKTFITIEAQIDSSSILPGQYYSFETKEECQEQVSDINKMNGYPRQDALTYCKCIKFDTMYYLPVDPVLDRCEKILIENKEVKINGKTISSVELNDYKQLPIKEVETLNK
jgi:hypothetical protein